MSGYTPGPWMQNGTHGHRFIGPADNEEGCVAIACKVDGRSGYKEMMANAQLIAAAPDLLAALENLENDAGQIPDAAWKMVKDAIARATGEK